MAKDVLGVDIGGVIIARLQDGDDTSFQKDFLKTPAVTGAIETLRQLADHRFGSNIHLVSKCGPFVEDLTLQWLEAHFFLPTRINPANVHFCRARKDKSPICEALGITHFVDDRLEVLSALTTVRNLYLFQPVQQEMQAYSQYLDRVSLIHDWKQLGTNLLSQR